MSEEETGELDKFISQIVKSCKETIKSAWEDSLEETAKEYDITKDELVKYFRTELTKALKDN